MERRLSLLDRIVIGFDRARKQLAGEAPTPRRASPADAHDEAGLDVTERRHVAGLMRVNHTGEVCAQALYQGQALTARLDGVRGAMTQAAEEEIDHLAWCAGRVHELGERTSVFNPVFYVLSFGIGALAGAVGDRWSLGFVAATEDQVCRHLREHLERLPADDERSRAILQQMLEDEARHATRAREHGASEFAPPVREAMTLLSRLMTATTYRI